MEDLKRRLELDNTSIQIQAAWKLYHEVVRKTPKDGESQQIIASEVIELKLLWDRCGEGDDVAGKSCCQALVQLVHAGKVDFNSVLSGLLNLVPSARNLSGLVAAVGELLVLQIHLETASGGGYTCPYSIRNPPHPFTTILTNRPAESWPLLQQEVLTLSSQDQLPQSSHKHLVSMLVPFLKFVLLEPHQSAQFSPMRNGLQRALLHICTKGPQPIRNQLLDFLVNNIGALQINTLETFTNSADFVISLTDIVLADSEHSKSTLEILSRNLIGLIRWALTKYGWATTSLVSTLQQVALECPKVIARSDNLVSLSALLLQAPMDVWPSLLSVVNAIITQEEVSLSPIILGMIVMPAVQVISLPTATILDPHLKKSQKLSSEILNALKVHFQKHRNKKKKISGKEFTIEGFLITSALYDDALYTKLAQEFSGNKKTLKSWLQNLKLSLVTMTTIPLSLTNLVVGLLLTSDCLEVMALTLEVIVQIAKNDQAQAPNFLAVLLFELGRGRSPEKRLAILNTIPKVASHKVCVAPILRTIQMLGKHPKLKALSLHLLTELWKLQDRCFPHLYSLLVENDKSQPIKGAVDEWLVAKAACMKEICKARPHQHGADLLSPLSEVLNQCLGVEGSVPTALALQGLHALCQAEVIDLKSAWAVLAGSLGNDTRPVVVEQLCELLSLAASADLKIPENEVFLHETVGRLWRYTQVTNHQISGAAFRALAAFPVDTFSLSMLPPSVTEEFKEEARRQAEGLGDEKITMDSLYQYIPGVCFSDLLQAQPPKQIQDFGVLLSSVVRAEICNLPRGVHHSSTRHRGGASNKNKAVASIPGFLLTQYEQTKQPGLRPALAGSLLFCYDPPLEVGRDGRPRQRHFIARSKSYQQMFTTLLQEVPIQPSEWHRTLTLPAAWTAFVGRVFIATLEGRRGELELQTRHGHLHEAEAEDKHSSAWLWARDSLTDVIKAASRGAPSAQANSILALAGLMAAASRFMAGLPVEELKKLSVITEHKSHSHWSTVAMDTMMSLMDSNFKPKGQMLGLCQPAGRQASKQTPMTGSLARSAVAISFSQTIPALMSLDTERIYQMIDMLKAGVKKQPDQSAVFWSHCGLGLGMLLSQLFEEHFADVGGTRGMTEIWKALDVLEQCAFDTKSNNRRSCILGLGVALSGLCGEGKTDSRVRVQLLLDKLVALLESASADDDSFQALCFCVSLVAASAFTANIISMETVAPILEKLKHLQSNQPENNAVSLSLGMLLHSLSSIGPSGLVSTNEKLTADWKNKLAQEDTSPLLKVALISGLMAMCGSETTLMQAHGQSVSEAKDTHSADVIKMCTQILTGQQDLGIQSLSAWSLGHLYQSLSTTAESRTGVPASYSYLPESSVLRALLDLLLEAGNKDREKIRPEIVEYALSSMVENLVQVLPPVNWTAVLSPLMRLNFGTRVKCLCLRLAVAQSPSSPPAAMVITTWLGQSLFASLDDECKLLLYHSLPSLMKTISPTILKKFLLRSCTLPFVDAKVSHVDCCAVLQGLSAALRVPDPPEAVTAVLYEMTEHLYSVLPWVFEPPIYAGMCHCLSELPDELVDKIILEDFSDPANHIKGTYARCHLVAVGRQPMALLNGCIDATMNTPNCDLGLALNMVSHCLYQTSMSASQSSGVVPRIQWLLEFLGHSKNVALGAIPLRVENTELILPLAINFAVQSVSAAISLWSSPVLGGAMGLNPKWFPEISSSPSSEDKELVKANTTEDFLSMLSGCLTHLEKHPWDQILSQVLDWLWEFSRLPTDKLSLGHAEKCKEALLMLRHAADFKKNMTWTKVLGRI